MELISRKEAITQGLLVYFTGEPCIHSHTSPRRVSNYGCMECARIHSAAFKRRQPEYFRDYRRLNAEHLTSYDQDYYRTRKARSNA